MRGFDHRQPVACFGVRRARSLLGLTRVLFVPELVMICMQKREVYVPYRILRAARSPRERESKVKTVSVLRVHTYCRIEMTFAIHHVVGFKLQWGLRLRGLPPISHFVSCLDVNRARFIKYIDERPYGMVLAVGIKYLLT